MKVLVLTDETGDVIGTMRQEHLRSDGDVAEMHIYPFPGQDLHQIDVSPEDYAIQDGEEFHRAVRLALRNSGCAAKSSGSEARG